MKIFSRRIAANGSHSIIVLENLTLQLPHFYNRPARIVILHTRLLNLLTTRPLGLCTLFQKPISLLSYRLNELRDIISYGHYLRDRARNGGLIQSCQNWTVEGGWTDWGETEPYEPCCIAQWIRLNTIPKLLFVLTMKSRLCTVLSFALSLWLALDPCEAANSANSSAIANCATACGANGQCSDGKCVCYENYMGTDCSIFVQFCPDGAEACYYGGQCVLDNTTQTYSCDCTNAYAISEADGTQCGNANIQRCIQGQVVTDSYSYCINGGRCKALIAEGDPDPGCNCLSGFEGLHCEYSTAETASTQSSTDSGGSGLSGLMKFYVVLIVLAAILSMVTLGIVIRRRRIRDKFQKESADSLRDLQLGTEGETDSHGLKVEDVEIS